MGNFLQRTQKLLKSCCSSICGDDPDNLTVLSNNRSRLVINCSCFGITQTRNRETLQHEATESNVDEKENEEEDTKNSTAHKSYYEEEES